MAHCGCPFSQHSCSDSRELVRLWPGDSFCSAPAAELWKLLPTLPSIDEPSAHKRLANRGLAACQACAEAALGQLGHCRPQESLHPLTTLAIVASSHQPCKPLVRWQVARLRRSSAATDAGTDEAMQAAAVTLAWALALGRAEAAVAACVSADTPPPPAPAAPAAAAGPLEGMFAKSRAKAALAGQGGAGAGKYAHWCKQVVGTLLPQGTPPAPPTVLLALLQVLRRHAPSDASNLLTAHAHTCQSIHDACAVLEEGGSAQWRAVRVEAEAVRLFLLAAARDAEAEVAWVSRPRRQPVVACLRRRLSDLDETDLPVPVMLGVLACSAAPAAAGPGVADAFHVTPSRSPAIVACAGGQLRLPSGEVLDVPFSTLQAPACQHVGGLLVERGARLRRVLGWLATLAASPATAADLLSMPRHTACSIQNLCSQDRSGAEVDSMLCNTLGLLLSVLAACDRWRLCTLPDTSQWAVQVGPDDAFRAWWSSQTMEAPRLSLFESRACHAWRRRVLAELAQPGGVSFRMGGRQLTLSLGQGPWCAESDQLHSAVEQPAVMTRLGVSLRVPCPVGGPETGPVSPSLLSPVMRLPWAHSLVCQRDSPRTSAATHLVGASLDSAEAVLAAAQGLTQPLEVTHPGTWCNCGLLLSQCHCLVWAAALHQHYRAPCVQHAALSAALLSVARRHRHCRRLAFAALANGSPHAAAGALLTRCEEWAGTWAHQLHKLAAPALHLLPWLAGAVPAEEQDSQVGPPNPKRPRTQHSQGGAQA